MQPAHGSHHGAENSSGSAWNVPLLLGKWDEGKGKKFRLFLIPIQILHAASAFPPECLAGLGFLRGGLVNQ